MKKLSNRKQNKARLIFPMVMILFFMILMVSYTSRLLYQASVSNIHEVGEDRIMNTTAKLENYLDTATGVVWAVCDAVDTMKLRGASNDQILEFLTEETKKTAEDFDTSYTGIYGYISDEYLDGAGWIPDEEYDPTSREWYTMAINSAGKPVIVPPYVDAKTGDVIISVSRMLSAGGDVIALDLTLNSIREMVDDLKVKDQGYGFVMDRRGLIVAHDDETLKGKYIQELEGKPNFLRIVKRVERGSFEYDFMGDKSTIFVDNIMNQWYSVIIIKDKDLYAGIHKQLLATIVISFLIYLMVVIFYCLAYSNEQNYSKRMEKLILEEQTQEYEKKMLEMEKDAANASNRAKSIFLANVSHEIRTPMNAIIGINEMILRNSRDEKIKKYAFDIQSAGKTLLSIINDILDLSKIESGKLELLPIEYSFASVINDVLNMTRKKALDKGLEYKMIVSPLIPSKLYGDEIRLRQIMLNLINNAIKYTSEGSVTTFISFDANSSKLKIIVKDTGIGIKDEDIGKLFEPFQRIDESKNRTIEGTGLGLSITAQLVEMMGGQISLESEYEKGSVFTATVMQKVVDDTPIGDFATNLSQIQDQREEYAPSLRAPRARILIVDDNDMNLEVITNLLSDTGIGVYTASSGAECIDMLRKSHYHMLFLDQMMPNMNGIETLEIIKKEHLADGMPIIALTADAVASAKETYLSRGFSDYLSKPVMYKELEKMLIDYLDAELIGNSSEIKTDTISEEEKSLVIVIDDSPERLRNAKRILNDSFKGIYVRDYASAAKYLEKHE